MLIGGSPAELLPREREKDVAGVIGSDWKCAKSWRRKLGDADMAEDVADMGLKAWAGIFVFRINDGTADLKSAREAPTAQRRSEYQITA